MSAQRTRAGRPAPPAATLPSQAGMEERRARRAASRRRTRLARLDLGIGVGCALFIFIVSPGLAITGVLAIVVLAVCVGSVLLERRRRRHVAEARTPRSSRSEAKHPERARTERARERPPSSRRPGKEVWDTTPAGTRDSSGGSRGRSPEIW